MQLYPRWPSETCKVMYTTATVILEMSRYKMNNTRAVRGSIPPCKIGLEENIMVRRREETAKQRLIALAASLIRYTREAGTKKNRMLIR